MLTDRLYGMSDFGELGEEEKERLEDTTRWVEQMKAGSEAKRVVFLKKSMTGADIAIPSTKRSAAFHVDKRGDFEIPRSCVLGSALKDRHLQGIRLESTTPGQSR